MVRRYAEVAVFVFAWMALGWVFHLGANAYLLLGVPLTAAFQLGVRRKPLADAWVRGAAPLSLPPTRLARVAVGAMAPVLYVRWRSPGAGWAAALWWAACALGILPALYAARRLDRAGLRELGLCLATGGALGCAYMFGFARFAGIAAPLTWAAPVRFGENFVPYFFVMFVLEEVTFRGVLDSHLSEAGTGRGWGSALLVSALWGLWHLPFSGVSGAAALLRLAAAYLLVHILIGVPLSLFWRRSGNLAVPAFTHAFVDAFRNVLLRM